MSVETSQWLNNMTLIGFTEKRGKAWHYRAEDQGDEPNHYVGAVPIEDVRRRLFNWQAVEGIIRATATFEGPDGFPVVVEAPADHGFKAIMRSDTGAILFVPKEGYTPHQYDAWLLDTVGDILDDDLQIGSAGLLRNGGQAWVSVEVPDSIVTPSGIVFRPHLLAATSLDGSLSTTYKRVVTNVVCDNTMAAALWERDGDGGPQTVRIKHSRHSHAKLGEVREALQIVHTIADDFTRDVEELTNTTVTDAQWDRFLNTLPMSSPNDPKTGKPREGRSLTMAQNRRAELMGLYTHDERVAPWAGTAWGVVQAVNTHLHHVSGSKTGTARAQVNMGRAVTGQFDKLDRDTTAMLQGILAPA